MVNRESERGCCFDYGYTDLKHARRKKIKSKSKNVLTCKKKKDHHKTLSKGKLKSKHKKKILVWQCKVKNL